MSEYCEAATKRRHPDLFDADEAAYYLCLEGTRSLEWVESEFGLLPYTFGRKKVYYRPDLDLVLDRMLGIKDDK